MFLSKEATRKYQQLKTQMVLSFQDDESKNTENVWQESGFFDNHRSDLTIPKANFRENTLVYINQGSVSVVKGGGQAIYLKFVVCGQLMAVPNPDPSINLETHVFNENEALLYVPVYNKVTGLYSGLTKKLAHITLRGDDYGFCVFIIMGIQKKKHLVVLHYEASFAKHFSLHCF